MLQLTRKTRKTAIKHSIVVQQRKLTGVERFYRTRVINRMNITENKVLLTTLKYGSLKLVFPLIQLWKAVDRPSTVNFQTMFCIALFFSNVSISIPSLAAD